MGTMSYVTGAKHSSLLARAFTPIMRTYWSSQGQRYDTLTTPQTHWLKEISAEQVAAICTKSRKLQSALFRKIN